MCPVKCSPRRITEERLQRERRGHSWRFYFGVFIVLLSLSGAVAVKLELPGTQQATQTIRENRVYLAVYEAVQPVTRVASGDLDYMERWINRQRTTQLLLLCTAGIALGLFYIMWK